MYTTCLLIALAGVVAPAQGNDGLAWQNDYGQAKVQGAAEKKPLLVVVATGKDGWNKLARSGTLPKESQELAANYICVYVDAGTPEGQRLAKALDVTGGLGVVISDPTGKLMAFHHEGNLDESALNGYLKRFADPNRVVTTTESNPATVRRSNYQAAPASPVITPAPVSYPAFAPSNYCPSCRR